MSQIATKWGARKSAGRGQGLVIDEATGNNIAVAYEEKNAPLLAGAPELRDALEQAVELLRNSDVRFHICDGGRGNMGEQAWYSRVIRQAQEAISNSRESIS